MDCDSVSPNPLQPERKTTEIEGRAGEGNMDLNKKDRKLTKRIKSNKCSC